MDDTNIKVRNEISAIESWFSIYIFVPNSRDRALVLASSESLVFESAVLGSITLAKIAYKIISKVYAIRREADILTQAF